MAYYGYVGRVLYVDLTSRETRKEPLDLQIATKFIGGMGVDLKLIYELLKPSTDPFSADNPIIIGMGPLVGTGAPGSARVIATTKYPQTGAIGSGSGAMRFGCMLKWAGYDQVAITGKASSPVYLKVINDDVEICDASHLWGKDLVETTERLWDEYGDCGVIAIGQAGENLVRIAQTLVDNGASLGRGGLGGVMGSKNLKAMVTRGTGSVKISDPPRFKLVVEAMFERARRYAYHQDSVDLGVMLNWPNYRGQLAYTKARSEIPDLERLDKTVGLEAYRKLGKKAFGCPSCFIADKEIIEVKEGRYKGLRWSTPSYLNAAIVAAKLGLEDCGDGVKFAELMDRYGLDQLSFSELLDFLITMYERGIITREDVGGFPLNRDMDTVITWAEKVTYRKGFGDAVADGWQGIVARLGKGIERETCTIKGRDGIWDPRVSGLGTNEFAQLVYPRGPNAESGGSALYVLNQPIEQVRRHGERMGMSKEAIERTLDSPLKVNIGRLTRSSEDWLAIFNSLGICNRHVNNRFYHIDICSELYSAATGFEMSSQELMRHADRVWNLFKMVNIREGFSRKDDEPPDKWFEPMKTFDGKEAPLMDYYRSKVLTREDVERWLDDYYSERGWDVQRGIPTKEKLTDLGLAELIPDLEKAGI